MRTVFVNGEYCSEDVARISIFDRGFLFADGVYEVSSVIDGKLVDNARHLARLHRSLAELSMVCPLSDAELTTMQEHLIEENKLNEGMIYLQITRGPAERDFAFPTEPRPSVIAFTQSRIILDNQLQDKGLTVVTARDIRWRRCDIKSIGLLAASMTKQDALDRGADDAWMVDDQGLITEGTSNNCYIVTHDGEIVTRPVSEQILNGITRRAIFQVAGELSLKISERAFTPAEAWQATEAFISSATTFCLPVVKIDGHTIGDGKPGPIFQKLRETYIAFARQTQQ